MLHSAAAPEGCGGVSIAADGDSSAASPPNGTGGAENRARGALFKCGNDGISGGSGRAILLPGNEYAFAGRAPGDGVGDGTRPGALADSHSVGEAFDGDAGRHSLARV